MVYAYGFLRSKIGMSRGLFYIFPKTSFVLGFKSVESCMSREIFNFSPWKYSYKQDFLKNIIFNWSREKKKIQVPY